MAPNLQIVCRDGGEPLIRYAAEELQRYVRRLFGFHPEVVSSPCGPHIAIAPQSNLPDLDDEEYIVRRRTLGGQDAVVCWGGSPKATLWAVYELVEQWGVHFMVQGDVIPDGTQTFCLPKIDIVRRPAFARRGFRVINDMANSGVFWSLSEHRRLFDQLAKMRFNAILIVTYPDQIWAHWSFRGVERSVGDLCYGFKHPIHAETIGRELFGDVANFTNPDFQGAETYEEKLAVGRRLMSGIIEAAHARGLDACFTHNLNDISLEILRHLPEWSQADGIDLPKSAVRQTQCARIGLAVVGGDPRLDVYRSPLNPVFLDLVETSFRAHIEAYPNVEFYGLSQSEFPPGGAGVRECWDALDAKYGIEKVFPLAELEQKARTVKVRSLMSQDRILTELHGAIQTLRMFDILLNERQVIQTSSNPDAKLIGTFMSEYIQPLLPLVMPADRFEFMAIVDYLPSHVADRMHTLSFVKSSPVPVSMITTVEDDNVGFFPQLVTQSLHRTVAKMREYGLKGFWFRQFDISEHEPTMYYLARSAWEDDWTPEAAYRRFVCNVCGSGAVDGALRVFKMVEGMEERSNDLCGEGFLMPHLYSKYWSNGDERSQREEKMNAFLAYSEEIKAIVREMQEVVAQTQPRGRKWAGNYLRYLRFATEFPVAAAKMIEARVSYEGAIEARKEGDFNGHGECIDRAVALLQEAVELSRVALLTWKELVVDPTDLGTLAALNAYGHDYLKGLAWQVYLESQHYGFSVRQ